jgi:hypothetical protein
MAERKVLVKLVLLDSVFVYVFDVCFCRYFPPEFDPSLLPRTKKLKNKQQTVNMMMPMSVTCTSCGNYIYRGTKFNSKKETVQGEDYLGIRIFRFYMRCNNCSAEFTIKTDPKNSDYAVELGCTRQMEPWKEKEDIREALIEKRVGEEQGDVMKELENKTMDSKMEMDILDGLDEIKALNARAAGVKLDELIAKRAAEDDRLDEADQLQLVETFEGVTKRLLHAEDKVDVDALLTRRKRKAVEPATNKTSVVTPAVAAPVAVVAKKPEQKKVLKLVDY